MSKVLFAITFFVSISFCLPADADLIRYVLTGDIVSAGEDDDETDDEVRPNYVGGKFRFTLFVDAGAEDSNSSNKTGLYETQSSGKFRLMKEGLVDYVGNLINTQPQDDVEIKNDVGDENDRDRFSVNYAFKGEDLRFDGDRLSPFRITFRLTDNDGLEFSSDALPTSFSSDTWFDRGKGRIEFGGGDDDFDDDDDELSGLNLRVRSMKVSAIPEPSTACLALLSLVGLCFRRNRK